MAEASSTRTVRFALVAMVLFGLLFAMAMRPDDGTAVHLSQAPPAADSVGSDHAKPLPRTIVPPLLVQALAFAAVVILVVAATAFAGLLPQRRSQAPRRDLLRSLAIARRGPPAFV